MWDGTDSVELTKSEGVTAGQVELNQTSLDDWSLECLAIKYISSTEKYKAMATDCTYSFHYSLCEVGLYHTLGPLRPIFNNPPSDEAQWLLAHFLLKSAYLKPILLKIANFELLKSKGSFTTILS